AQVAQPLPHGPQPRLRAASLRDERPEPGDERERDDERGDVDPVRRGDRRVEDHASHRGSDHDARLEADLAERGGDGDLLAAHEVGDDRGAGGRVDRSEPRVERGAHVDRPHARAGDRVEREADARRRHAHVGDEEQLAAIERVRQRAAEQRERDDRTELGEAQQPDLERRVREREHLELRGDDGQLAPEERDELTAVQQPVLRGLLERRDVQQDTTPRCCRYGSAFSIVSTTSGASGSIMGLKRATISPPGAMTNFSKFHRMSPVWPSPLSGTSTSWRYRAWRSSPFTSTFSVIGNVTP